MTGPAKKAAINSLFIVLSRRHNCLRVINKRSVNLDVHPSRKKAKNRLGRYRKSVGSGQDTCF